VASADDSATGVSGGDLTTDAGTVFSQTFDGTGVQLYVCEVHEGAGMLSTVDVV